MNGPVPDITILGAGIGGLACAIACRLRGHTVDLIEQAPALTDVGAGIQIAPNGGRVLDALGVSPRSLASEAVHLIDGTTGKSVIRMPVGPGFRMVHRADLIEALAARADALGVAVRLGTKIAAIGQGGVHLLTADGTPIAVNRLIGADGAHGVSRQFVAPDHAAAFTGQVAWRAIVPVADAPKEAQVHMGSGRHLVCYPLRDGRSLNIVAVEERKTWTAAGWTQTDDPQNLRDAFSMLGRPVRELLARVEAVNLWGLMDHGVTPHWSRGGCTLIGDAAHPTLPFLAQGANLALEDSFTLAQNLEDIEGWESTRRKRVRRALDAAKGNARNYHLSGVQRTIGHGALRILARVSPRMLLRKYDWLYGADVTSGGDSAGSRRNPL